METTAKLVLTIDPRKMQTRSRAFPPMAKSKAKVTANAAAKSEAESRPESEFASASSSADLALTQTQSELLFPTHSSGASLLQRNAPPDQSQPDAPRVGAKPGVAWEEVFEETMRCAYAVSDGDCETADASVARIGSLVGDLMPEEAMRADARARENMRIACVRLMHEADGAGPLVRDTAAAYCSALEEALEDAMRGYLCKALALVGRADAALAGGEDAAERRSSCDRRVRAHMSQCEGAVAAARHRVRHGAARFQFREFEDLGDLGKLQQSHVGGTSDSGCVGADDRMLRVERCASEASAATSAAMNASMDVCNCLRLRGVLSDLLRLRCGGCSDSSDHEDVN